MKLTPIPAKPINIRVPLAFSPAGAFMTNDTTLDAVSDNLGTLLRTNWGERPMQYNYGANLRSVLFENMGDIQQVVTDHITSAVERWMPGVAILDVTVTSPAADISDNACTVQVMFGIAQSELTGQVSVTIK